MIEKFLEELGEEFKRLNFGERMGIACMLFGFGWTVISYFRLRRRSDRENGKGWRKRLRDDPYGKKINPME